MNKKEKLYIIFFPRLGLYFQKYTVLTSVKNDACIIYGDKDLERTIENIKLNIIVKSDKEIVGLPYEKNKEY